MAGASGDGLVTLTPRRAPAALRARFFVVFVPLRVGEDSGPLDLALEAPKRAVERFVFSDPHFGQVHTSSVSGRDRCRHYTRGAPPASTEAGGVSQRLPRTVVWLPRSPVPVEVVLPWTRVDINDLPANSPP